jgi:tetratricopeptide (TPR) repeat protein
LTIIVVGLRSVAVPVHIPGPDRLPAGPLRDLVEALHELYRDAGMPGVRVISNDIKDRQDLRDTVSYQAFSDMLHGTGLPRWDKVEAVVRVLAARSVSRRDPDAEVRRFHTLWLRVSDLPPPEPAAPDAPGDPVPRPTGAVDPPSGVHDRPTEIVERPADVTPRQLASDPVPEPSRIVRNLHVPRVYGNLPVRNDEFTGRDLILDELRRHLESGAGFPVVLHGLGGTGKTQIAVEYVYTRGMADCEIVWWVSADDPNTARTALAVLGERLELPATNDLQQTVRAVIAELERGREPWLLVFDNAELSDDLLALLPAVGGRVLLTSRDPGWTSVGTAIEVPAFDRGESIQFLLRRGRDISGADADLLAQRLGDLPLALEQVAAAQSATRMPVAEYLQLFEEHMQELLAAGRPRHYTVNLVAFVRIAVGRLRAESPTAAQLFELFAFLGTEPVGVTLLFSGQDAAVSAPLARALRDRIAMYRSIGDLRRYGLARFDRDSQRIEVHPLVQVALREALDQAARQRGRNNLALLLAAANPGSPDDVRMWDLHAGIAPHVVPAGLMLSPHLPARQVVVDQIRYLNRFGDYVGSRRLAELAGAAWDAEDPARRPPGIEDLRRQANFELAEDLRALGAYEPSRRISQESWDRLRENPDYGPDHVFTLRVASTVSAHHRVSGDYQAALSIDQDTLRRHEERLRRNPAPRPPDELQVLHAMNNLAVTMRLRGDFWGAFQIDDEVLRKRRAYLGGDDSRIQLSICNLARDHLGLGHYAQALELQQSSLPALSAQLRPRHHHLLLAHRTIAVALRKMGRYQEALDLARRNYEAYNEHFGPDHEHTLAATMSLANAVRDRAVAEGTRPAEANELAIFAVARYRRIFGEHNPVTLAAEVNHAVILRALGDRRARETDRITLAELRQAVGDEHPYTLSAAANFATDLALDGEFAVAREQSERTLQASERVRGEDHPDTLACAVNLALDIKQNGEPRLAQELLDNTMGSLRRALGPTHPSTVNAARGSRAECDIEPPPT